MKKILITGGAGFIGSNLCAYLLRDNQYKIICLDDLSSGNKKNILSFLKNPNFDFIQLDITKPFFKKVDEIYHLASPASPAFYQKHSLKTIKTNFLGTLNILELARKNRAKVLFSSTSEVYGDPQISPQPESYWGNVNPVGVRACYDESKRIAETLCFEYRRIYKLDIKIARIFNTYGPAMNPEDGRVVSNFIVQALKNKPLTVYGDGNQTRSFCYVSDLIEGLIRLMQKEDFFGPVNLGNPQEIKVKDLAERVIKLTQSKSKIIFRPLPLDDPKRRCPDISLAKKILNWEPKVSLEEGLTKTIDYFKNRLRKR